MSRCNDAFKKKMLAILPAHMYERVSLQDTHLFNTYPHSAQMFEGGDITSLQHTYSSERLTTIAKKPL